MPIANAIKSMARIQRLSPASACAKLLDHERPSASALSDAEITTRRYQELCGGAAVFSRLRRGSARLHQTVSSKLSPHKENRSRLPSKRKSRKPSARNVESWYARRGKWEVAAPGPSATRASFGKINCCCRQQSLLSAGARGIFRKQSVMSLFAEKC